MVYTEVWICTNWRNFAMNTDNEIGQLALINKDRNSIKALPWGCFQIGYTKSIYCRYAVRHLLLWKLHEFGSKKHDKSLGGKLITVM